MGSGVTGLVVGATEGAVIGDEVVGEVTGEMPGIGARDGERVNATEIGGVAVG